MASPSDWKNVKAELKRCPGNRFFIYASAANSYIQTLHGIDVVGRRLAEEVQQVIQKTPILKRISFLAHSLGGLFARYAIVVLFSVHDAFQDCIDSVVVKKCCKICSQSLIPLSRQQQI
jgi:hypothetical protein